jgi:DMSO/TMAO reductase YedYZ molybdopterin-dependent catalytic subunit
VVGSPKSLPDVVRTTVATARSKAEDTSEALSARVTSPLHSTWLGAVLGILLGVTFTVCFVTGLVDYLSQHPPGWFHLPAHPADLYRVNEGLHVFTGIATIPLLLAKLWVVWPELLEWPPINSALHALERLSLIPLVGGSLFLLFTGVVNIDYWYSPMAFTFTNAHFWTAWLVVGALVIHVGAKAATVRAELGSSKRPLPADEEEAAARRAAVLPGDAPGTASRAGLGRRGFLGAVAGTAGLLVAVAVGETISPLRRLAVLAPRSPDVGPQRVPVNQTALQAGVVETAADTDYRLTVTGRCRKPLSLSVPALQALPQRISALPITCVEGWSADAVWRGVPLGALLALAGAPPGVSVRVESLEDQHRLYSSSVVDAEHADDPDTLLALELNGETLDLDHGYPVRLIAPDRPGVLQTKWITNVVVL